MKQVLYNNQLFNLKELSEFTGIKYTTLSERLKRGYSVEEAITEKSRIPESIEQFVQASYPKDWDGMTNEELYKIYFNWCVRNEHYAESNVHFTRCLKRIVPNLRTVPTRLKRYDGIAYKRVIRIDGEI